MKGQSETHLVAHYSALGDFTRDFRNANLCAFITTLVNGREVVDIGSGAGFFCSMLQKTGKHVLGIEPNDGMRELASRINPEVRAVKGMAEDIETLVPTPVDAITMLDVLEHVEDDVAQVRRVHAVLNERGEFVIVVPAHPSLYGKRDEAMGHYRRYSKRSLAHLLTQNGFTITKLRYWNALGVLPYLVSEKILRRPLTVQMREGKKKGLIGSVIWRVVNTWMREVENRMSFGFGLSIVCIARRGSGTKT